MIKLSLFTSLLLLSSTLIMAENNATKQVDVNVTTTTIVESNQTVESNISKKDVLKQQVEEQMKREEKYAQEQMFYQGDAYDLKSREINEESLEKLETIEPDFDFDMDDVYRDDI